MMYKLRTWIARKLLRLAALILPREASTHLAFGSAWHEAMEDLYDYFDVETGDGPDFSEFDFIINEKPYEPPSPIYNTQFDLYSLLTRLNEQRKN